MGPGGSAGKKVGEDDDEPVDFFSWLHRFDFGAAMFHVASALGLAPAVAWQTSMADYLELERGWAKHPPIHLVAAAFVKPQENTPAPVSAPARPGKRVPVEAQEQQLSMEQGLGGKARDARHVPGHEAFAKKLDQVGGDPAKMREALEESARIARRNEIRRMREEAAAARQAQAKIARGRPTW